MVNGLWRLAIVCICIKKLENKRTGLHSRYVVCFCMTKMQCQSFCLWTWIIFIKDTRKNSINLSYIRRVKRAGKLISDISSNTSNSNWGKCLTMFPPGIGVDARTCNLGCSPWPLPFYIAQVWPASSHVQTKTHSLAEEQNRHTYTPVSRTEQPCILICKG